MNHPHPWLTEMNTALRLSVCVFSALILTTSNNLCAAPLIIAHRGASGERPEHTLSAYKLALEQGADYIEPDLRSTKDGVLIALHDTSLNRTTDVAAHSEFAARAKYDRTGAKIWSPGDFTLAEIKSLRNRQGTKGRPNDFDGKEGIPTLLEIIELVQAWNREHHTRVGVIPELRGDADLFIEFAKKNGLATPEAPPVYLQSFEEDTLREVRRELGFPSALLSSQAPTLEQLPVIKASFDAVAVRKDACLKPDSAEWIKQAHHLGLKVIAWTFDDAKFDKTRFKSSVEEMQYAFRNGIDALFTDFPSSGVQARDSFNAHGNDAKTER